MSAATAQPRRVAVVTGTRADYGLLEPVCRAIAKHPDLVLQLVATGTHLITRSVRDLAFPVAARVTMQKRDRVGRRHDAAALGRGIAGLTEAFAQLDPAYVVVLGDRIEAFAAASAASVMGIRVAHLHGGDRAEGVADEAMRHAITKLAHLHLPATATSARRLRRMGEPAATIHRVGSPAIDGLREIPPATAAPSLLILHHPVGHDDATEREHMSAILAATAGSSRTVLAPNRDPGRAGIKQAIRDADIEAIEHLPRPCFVALLKAADAIVGNSSAGLIEAAACRTPAVNVGTRQNGRERPNSVVDAPPDETQIRAALRTALALDRRRFRHPYGNGTAGPRVAHLLANLDLATLPIRKQNSY